MDKLPGYNWDTFMSYQNGDFDPPKTGEVLDAVTELQRKRTALWLAQRIMRADPNDNVFLRFDEVAEENGLSMNGFDYTADELAETWLSFYEGE